MWQWLFPDNDEGVLNPSFFFAHDIGSILGVWMEFGLSHSFTIPGIDNLTITPGWTLAINGDYWVHSTMLAADVWSLVAEYDLTPVLNLPKWAGNVSIGGQLFFLNMLGNIEEKHQGQDEFYFALSFDKMDLALWAHDQKLPATQLAEMIDLPVQQAEYVYRDIEIKRSTTAMLHWPGLLVESVAGPLSRPDSAPRGRSRFENEALREGP